MNHIDLSSCPRGSYKRAIIELFNNLGRLNGIQKGKNIIDFNNYQWVSPLGILPIAAFLKKSQEEGYKFDINLPENNYGAYLRTICFPEGINSTAELKLATDIPIICIASSKDFDQSRLLKLLLHNIGKDKIIPDSLALPISELFDNIWEHSHSDYGWLLVQYDKSSGSLDITILDTGITIKKSYERADLKVTTDIEALKMALNERTSSKGSDRGFGLSMSTKNLITKSEFEGDFFLVSGQGGYYSGNTPFSSEMKRKEFFLNLPENWNWPGTLINLRINKIAKVDIYPYIE